MIGFGADSDSNDFNNKIAAAVRKIPPEVSSEGEYISQESSNSTNIEALSRLSVVLAEETKLVQSGSSQKQRN